MTFGLTDALGDPVLHEEAFEMRGIRAHFGRQSLERGDGPALLVLGEENLAAASRMQLAHDAPAVEHHSRREQRRERHVRALLQDFIRVGLGQLVDANDDRAQVVGAAAIERFGGHCARSGIEIRGIVGYRVRDESRAREFVHPVGRDHEHVARLEPLRLVVHLEMGLNAERTAQIAGLLRNPHPVILRELLERAVAQPVDAGVAGVEEMRGAGLEHERGERADVPVVAFIAIGALSRLGIEPRIDGHQHALRGFLHRPRGGRAVVILEEPAHGRLARGAAHAARADAVGESDGDAFRREQGLDGNAGTMEVLVHFLAPALGVLPERDSELTRHAIKGTDLFGAKRGRIYSIRPLPQLLPVFTPPPSAVCVSAPYARASNRA